MLDNYGNEDYFTTSEVERVLQFAGFLKRIIHQKKMAITEMLTNLTSKPYNTV